MSINYVKWLNEKGLSEGNDTFEVIMDQYEWRKEAMKKLTASAHPDRMVKATGDFIEKAKTKKYKAFPRTHELINKYRGVKGASKHFPPPLSPFKKFIISLKYGTSKIAKSIR